MPDVSIITPLFDKGRYIAETIRSVQMQTVPDWELLVVENGSRDDGPEQVRQQPRWFNQAEPATPRYPYFAQPKMSFQECGGR